MLTTNDLHRHLYRQRHLLTEMSVLTRSIKVWKREQWNTQTSPAIVVLFMLMKLLNINCETNPNRPWLTSVGSDRNVRFTFVCFRKCSLMFGNCLRNSHIIMARYLVSVDPYCIFEDVFVNNENSQWRKFRLLIS